ncbi:MAG: helix-turn-helix transcriptional regulator [Treponema sp.]|nr:helix-turn-helix transcriptional regulator [Treponema sp.]
MESVIKILREQNRYTQVKLAEVLGISRQALIKYESLELEPPLSVIRGLAKLFSVNYEFLIDNKLPDANTSEDEQMIEQLSKDFVKLKDSEKYAVLEMTRIMAKGGE